MSEAADSPLLFDDSMATVEEESAEVANVTDEIETIEIEDSAVDMLDSSSAAAAKKKPTKSNIPTVLPLSKVKKICKLDPEINMVTADAVKLITFCAERFIEILAKSCASCAKEQGRKTVSNVDFQRAIRRSWLFYMLDEAVDEWPDNNAAPAATGRSKSAASNRSSQGKDIDVNDDEEDAAAGEEDEIADSDEIIQDDEVIEIDETEEIIALERSASTPMEEDDEVGVDEEELGIQVEQEDDKESSEESDIENQDMDSINESFVKDIEDF